MKKREVMKLWLISQNQESGYDTYDSAVVAALTEEDARKTHPGGRDYDWIRNLNLVTVELIGVALPGTEAGVVCASFNAG